MNKARYILWGILFIFLAATVITLTGTVLAAPVASPLLDDPTPTPYIGYFLGDTVDITAVGNGYHEPPAGSHFYDFQVDGKIDLLIPNPESQEAHGYLITLNTDTYSGDSFIQYGTNTGWMRQASTNGADPVMTVGNTYCCGTAGACSYAGESVDSECSWATSDQDNAGYPDVKFFKSFRTSNTVGDGGTVAYTLRDIFYGEYDCDPVIPEDRLALSTGLLFGTDEVGEVFDLTLGVEYLLYTEGGPWNDGTDDRYDAGVRFFDGADWGEWEALADVEGEGICNEGEFLDAHGAALLFVAAEDQTKIQFRVNDDDDNFDDNSGDLTYYWKGAEGNSQSCATGFTKGTLVGSVTVDSTDSAYQSFTYPEDIQQGVYALTVTGSYLDNGVASNDTRVADFPENAGDLHDNWADYNLWTGLNTCTGTDTATLKEYYGEARDDFYDPDETFNLGRAFPQGLADDGDANYGNNSGTILLEVHESVYTPPANDCATKYDIGTFVESPIIMAKNSSGIEYPQQIVGLTVGEVYYLANEGTPYFLDGTPSHDFEVRYDSESNWSDPEVFFDCITPVDVDRNGHYFIAAEPTIWLRAEFNLSHDDNSGSVKFNLYGATNHIVPDDETCGDYYNLDTLTWRGTIAADSTAGYSIDQAVFTEGDEYAIKITQAYTDPDGTGKTGEMRRAAPNTGAVSYGSFEDFDGATCYEQDDGYDVVYFEAAALSDYEVRATEPGGGNTGTMGFEVWELERLQETKQGCEMRDYGDVDFWWLVKTDEEIDANNNGEDGTGILLANSFDPDTKYKLETTTCWGHTETNCLLEVSTDGGGIWIGLEDWVGCYVEVGPYSRGLWTGDQVVGTGPFLVRVYDASGIYFDNVGLIKYNLWVDNEAEDHSDIYDDWLKDGWGAGCSADCPAPGFLQVGEWIENARCKITNWFSWCPWHVKALKDAEESFYGMEPFGTMFELLNLGNAVKAEIDTYNWIGDSGGSGEPAEVQAPRNFLFAPGEGGGAEIPIVGDTTIWGSGEIDLSPDNPANQRVYSRECDNLLADSLGTRLAGSMCFSLNVLDQLGLKTWFQWSWDMFMVISLLLYVKNNWVDTNS